MITANNLKFLREIIGMPTHHATAFTSVARSQDCVIIVRATGPTCLQPLEEQYCTKGYRIHGKSCNWGPMAGFVLRDPRLNKSGMAKAAFNRSKHLEAIENDRENQGWKASVTPLIISEARRIWLVNNNYIEVVKKGDRWDGMASHHSGIQFYYSLIEHGNGLWGVYFDKSRNHSSFQQERGNAVVHYHAKYGSSYEPMLALTNPPEHRTYRPDENKNYLNAVTGDYDLFAIWPCIEDYQPNPGGDDYRPLGTTNGVIAPERENIERLERDFTDSGQGTKLGNITNRIYLVGQLINSLVGRNVIWHSDESARPSLKDVDLPVVAFAPNGHYYSIESISEFKLFIQLCEFDGIRVTLSSAWVQEPSAEYPNRLGGGYENRVPANTIRLRQPSWYNA